MHCGEDFKCSLLWPNKKYYSELIRAGFYDYVSKRRCSNAPSAPKRDNTNDISKHENVKEYNILDSYALKKRQVLSVELFFSLSS
jgi:hypothetical protein